MPTRHLLLLLALPLAVLAAHAEPPARTPIRHVVVVVGENVSFDALFGTYVPPKGETIRNLLSEGLVRADGSPGPAYGRAIQHRQKNRNGQWSVDLARGAPYARLPQPSLAGVFNAKTLEGYEPDPDPRFASMFARGPFQITHHAAYGTDFGLETGDPVHRFFQMWQQTGGSNADLTRYTWVATTAGRGPDSPGITPEHIGQGAEVMGFLSMAGGDAPTFRALAERYALSDNYHQSFQGGTTANFLALATGDAARYELNGQPVTPPLRQIDDPTPQPGTENFYTRDGGHGGAYARCDDSTAPGVAAIRRHLASLKRDPNCAPRTYYLLNNQEPPFLPDGTADVARPSHLLYPPQTNPEIGTALTTAGIGWAWYSGGRDGKDLTDDPLYAGAARLARERLPNADAAALAEATATLAREMIYNNSGDPLVSFPRVIHGPDRAKLLNMDAFHAAIAEGSLPSVSFVVPKNVDSGHPGYSVTARYEAFVKDLVARFEANPTLFASTAIVITTDEGGGYFDSGWIQTVDFFGDGPRIPLIVVSPYARRGHVDHVYQDHASVLKFIEYNWNLPPLSQRSRDRLPNPLPGKDPYRPANQPAIGDLTTLFDFGGAKPAR
ncbi:MAG: alkaline phosphatase family protein [Pseudomonadota bacterium]